MNDQASSSDLTGSSDSAVQPWEARRLCRSVDPFEIRMSRGFLRSSPARWFPGLNSHWLPLLHSTGCDFKVLEVTPLLSGNLDRNIDLLRLSSLEGLKAIGAWLIDEEAVLLYVDTTTRNALVQAFIPNSSRYSRKIMLDYLCRRVAFSLKASWSGMQSSSLSYDSEFDTDSFSPQAWIQVRGTLNNEKVSFLFGLSRILAEKLDGLWRRQLRPANSGLISGRLNKQTPNSVRFEIARLSVAPQSLPAYLKSGNLVDLEIPVSNNILLRIDQESWISSYICCCGDKFAFETASLSPTSLHVTEGATPLSIELGSISLDTSSCVELEQAGAILETDLPLSDLVQLSIRGEKVGRARLVGFEGRFALSIL